MSREDGRRVTKMADNTKDYGFYNAQDGLKGRDGGPYLDHVERQNAEKQRALVEGREPADLNGPLPATAGTTVVPAAYVIDNSLTSNPSMRFKPGFESLFTDSGIKDLGKGKPYGPMDEASTADPLITVPVDQTTDQNVEPAHPNVTDVPGDSANKSNSQTLVSSDGKTTDTGSSTSSSSTPPSAPASSTTTA